MRKGTQADLAERLGVKSQCINQILSGRRRAGWELANALAKETETPHELWGNLSKESIKKKVAAFDRWSRKVRE